jgi:hypothetical protein
MLKIFKRSRLLLLKIWLPVLANINIILIIGTNPLTSSPSFSQSASPRTTQTQQSKELPIIYEALADDIIQIFKWMETPGITPSELAMYILGHQSNSTDVSLPTNSLHPGLPSFKDIKYIAYRRKNKNDITIKKYIYGVDISINGFKSPQEKMKISAVWIRPFEANGIDKTWYDNFSAIKFIDYLSKGTEKPERRITEYNVNPNLYQSINLKQKYFKSSIFKKYILSIESSPKGDWRLPNGENYSIEKQPYILLQLDPTEE